MTTNAADALERLESFLAAYSKSRQLDQSVIHTMCDGDTFELRPSDIRECIAVARASLAERQGEAVSGEMDRSAPSRIWLQVDTAGDETDRTEAIPESSWEQMTWHFESLGGQEIGYVRADLCNPAPMVVTDAMVERALNAYYCHGISWQEAAKLCGDTREEMRAALTAALQNGAE